MGQVKNRLVRFFKLNWSRYCESVVLTGLQSNSRERCRKLKFSVNYTVSELYCTVTVAKQTLNIIKIKIQSIFELSCLFLKRFNYTHQDNLNSFGCCFYIKTEQFNGQFLNILFLTVTTRAGDVHQGKRTSALSICLRVMDGTVSHPTTGHHYLGFSLSAAHKLQLFPAAWWNSEVKAELW